MPPNTTAVLIGKSGVGKSSLINMLVGHELQETTPCATATVRAGTPR
ncbi:MAG: GTPase RsgA [Eggerthellaceae bacterium]